MRGAPLATSVREQVTADVRELGEVALATILVGDDPASHIYVSKKHEAGLERRLQSFDHRLPGDAPEADLLMLLDDLNRDDAVDGILVQLPLPSHISEAKVLRAVEPVKDVDCFHPFNAGQL